MRRRSISVAVALVVASGVISCGDAAETARASSQKLATPLVEGFSSRQPTVEVEDALRRAGKRITVVEDGAPGADPSNARPPLSVRVVRVSPFELWGMEGDLRLEFVDGALSSTWFYPNDPKKFDVSGNALSYSDPRGLQAQPAACAVGSSFGGPVGCAAGVGMTTLGTLAGLGALVMAPSSTSQPARPSDMTREEERHWDRHCRGGDPCGELKNAINAEIVGARQKMNDMLTDKGS